ncbi:hypothetical protein LINGRAHAP2_LOCUS5524 [Linum grandiflorum]
MAGLPMMTRTTVLTPSMAFSKPQSSPSGLRTTAPAWPKPSRVSFTKLSAAKEEAPKTSAEQLKESVEGVASAVSKKFDEDVSTAKDLKASAEGDVEKSGGKAQEIHETLKEAGETAADKAKKDVEGAWDAAKGTTDKIMDTLSGKDK